MNVILRTEDCKQLPNRVSEAHSRFALAYGNPQDIAETRHFSHLSSLVRRFSLP